MSAPVPSPCTTRPATSTGIEGASPLTSTPTVNSTSDTSSAPAGPRRSLHAPAATMPTTELASGAANASA